MPNDDKTPGLGAPRTTSEKGEVDRLLQDLRDFNDQVREKAVIRLGEIRDRQVLQALIGRLTNDKSPRVRFFAVEAIYRIGDAQAWPQLISSLPTHKEEDESVRAKIIEVLGLIGDKQYSKHIVEALKDSDKVWKQAVLSLGRVKDPAILQDLISGLSRYNRSSYNAIRYMDALVAMELMVADAVLASAGSNSYYASDTDTNYHESGNAYILSEDYSDEFYRERVDILTRLGPPTIGVISKKLGSKPAAGVRVVATRTLSNISDVQSRNLLGQIAENDNDPVIRWLALNGLANQYTAQPDQIEQTYLKILQKDKEWRLRLRAIELLAQVNSSKAVKPFCTLAISDPSGEVRITAITSLGSLRDVQALPTLSTILLDNPDYSFRTLAAETMGVIGSGEALPHLLSALGSDRNVAVRKASAASLGKIKDRRAIEYLKSATANDPSNEVRQVAKDTLAQLR